MNKIQKLNDKTLLKWRVKLTIMIGEEVPEENDIPDKIWGKDY